MMVERHAKIAYNGIGVVVRVDALGKEKLWIGWNILNHLMKCHLY